MKVEFVNPFIQAAGEVLEAELGDEAERGGFRMHKTAFTTDEVTALVGVTGRVSGLVLYSMSEATARGIAAKMMRQPFEVFDEMAQSGIGELGNVITGRAGVLLEKGGISADIAPPMLIVGRGGQLSSLEIPRLVVPLHTSAGEIDLQIALRAKQ